MNKVSALWFCLLVFLSDCNTPRNNDGDLKYGTNDKFLEFSSILLRVSPGAKIAICGDHAALLNKVMMDWGRQIGRSQIFEVTEVCPPKSQVYAAVIETGDSKRNQHAAVYCLQKSGVAAYTQVTGEVGGRHLVFFCHPEENHLLNFKLDAAHEAGHLWGLCDQYTLEGSSIGTHTTCSKDFRSRRAELSVMNGSSIQDLSPLLVAPGVYLFPHDILSIRLLACRSDIPANIEWARIQKGLHQTWIQDPKFKVEIHRLASLGYKFLDQCMAGSEPGVEGAYSDEANILKVECCLCKEQDFESQGWFTSDQSLSDAYYTISNIHQQPFEQTLCHRRIGAKFYDVQNRSKYRFVHNCWKVSKEDQKCQNPEVAESMIQFAGETSDKKKRLIYKGQNRYGLLNW